MNIAVIGTGYVGLVSGVSLAEVGHNVVCIDIDEKKINLLREGQSPIYEPGIEELIVNNLESGRLSFQTSIAEGIKNCEVILLAVGTPPKENGEADLTYIFNAAEEIARHLQQDAVVMTKSTVPVGTNHQLQQVIAEHKQQGINVDIVSNPEFLREGSAIHDTFHGERIVIGAENERTAKRIEEMYKPFQIPILHTDICSAEMMKYASNAFLATKISFINEIANLCEQVGANVDDVAKGMGMDSRIGPKFLQSGIGYGGSCFPKDTLALQSIASTAGHPLSIVQAVIDVNEQQPLRLVKKIKEYFGQLSGKTAAVLGLAFKPNTDDMREAASVKIIRALSKYQLTFRAYDPIAMSNAQKVLGQDNIVYCSSAEEALKNADFAVIVTEWDEFIRMDLGRMKALLKQPLIFDGRNCFGLDQMKEHGFTYISIGRPQVNV